MGLIVALTPILVEDGSAHAWRLTSAENCVRALRIVQRMRRVLNLLAALEVRRWGVQLWEIVIEGWVEAASQKGWDG